MSIAKRLVPQTRAFLTDYCQRHRHPLNAGLHLIGVPMVALGIFKFIAGKSAAGALFFVFGYLLQYLGHQAQGNEVGEVTLAKKIWKRLRKNGVK